MPNLDAIVITGAEWKIFLAMPSGKTYELKTVESIDLDISRENEDIYAVGEEDPIANKGNARKFTGKISMQAGEIMTITSLEGLADASRITGATLACAVIRGGLQRTLRQVNINSERTTLSRKAKETLTSMDMSAVTNI